MLNTSAWFLVGYSDPVIVFIPRVLSPAKWIKNQESSTLLNKGCCCFDCPCWSTRLHSPENNPRTLGPTTSTTKFPFLSPSPYKAAASSDQHLFIPHKTWGKWGLSGIKCVPNSPRIDIIVRQCWKETFPLCSQGSYMNMSFFNHICKGISGWDNLVKQSVLSLFVWFFFFFGKSFFQGKYLTIMSYLWRKMSLSPFLKVKIPTANDSGHQIHQKKSWWKSTDFSGF